MNSQDYRNLQEAYLNVYQEIDEETAMAKRGKDETEIRNTIAKKTGASGAGSFADKATALAGRETYGDNKKKEGREKLARAQRGDFRNTTSSSPGLRGYAYKSNDPEVKAKQDARGAQRGRAALTPNERKQLNMEFDFYDIILSHLLDEGYADTQETAEVMMVNMSEEWREEILDEGIGSAIRGFFGKKQKPEAPEPLSRGAQLRQKYGTETSPKRQILDRTRERAEKDEKEYGDSPYSKSVAIKSRKTHDDYLKGGYSKYGAGEGSGGQGGSGKRGGGNAARRRAAALNKEQVDLFDCIMGYLIDEGYADTNENALVIMANMSEDWKYNILEAIVYA